MTQFVGQNNGGGGSPSVGITIGDPVIGGTPTDVLYIDNSGNLYDDTQFYRDSGVTKQMFIGSNTYAQTDVNDGVSAEVLIQADFVGDIGNSISLVFDGVSDVDTVLAAWNTANPGNTASIVDGVGTTVPTAGTAVFVGGGTVAYESGNVDMAGISFIQGSNINLFDSTNNLVAFSTVGNLTPILGQPALGIVAGGINTNTGELGLILANQTGIDFFVTDQSTYQAGIRGDSSAIEMAFNGIKFFVANNGDLGWSDQSSNAYILPTGVSPAIGDNLSVTGVAGSTYTLDFVTPGGGANTFSVVLGEDLTAYSGNTVALQLDYGFPNYQGNLLFKKTTQTVTTTGSGTGNLFTKSLKINQTYNFLISQKSTGLNIQAMYYDVITGAWGKSWFGTSIVDPMGASEFDCCKIDNEHFVIAYVDSSNNLKFATFRITNNGLQTADVYAVNIAQTYNSVKLTQSGGGIPYHYGNVSYIAERTDTGFIERGILGYHADFSIDYISAFTSTIPVGANSVNFQIYGMDFLQANAILYCEPSTGDYYIIEVSGNVVCSGTGGAFSGCSSLSIASLGYLDPSNIGWVVCWNSNVFNTQIGTIVYDTVGVSVSLLGTTYQIFAPDSSIDASFYSGSITRFVNETTSNGSRPNRLFGQRVVNTIDVELVDITVDYSTPLVPSFTTGTVNTLPLPDYEVGTGVISANCWRYETLANRNRYMMSIDYISSSAGGGSPERWIQIYDSNFSAWSNETWRKAEFDKAQCLVKPDGSSTAGATVTAYGPGATIPINTSVGINYVGSDGLNVTGTLTDVIAYEEIDSTHGIVMLTPYRPKQLDCYAGGPYPTEGYNLYKMYATANSIQPQITNPGYLTNEIKIINMVASTNQGVYITNENNTGVTSKGYITNLYDYIIVKPRIDFCDGGFDIIEDGRTRFIQSFDMNDTTYFKTNTLYLPYFWKNYGQVQLTNTTGYAIEFIKTDGNIGFDTRLFIQPADNSVDIVQTSVATPTANCIIGLNTTTTLSAHAATYYGDWIELDFKNNAWHKYNIEIYT